MVYLDILDAFSSVLYDLLCGGRKKSLDFITVLLYFFWSFGIKRLQYIEYRLSLC